MADERLLHARRAGGLRSLLFAPGNHARRREKAFECGADAVILDLLMPGMSGLEALGQSLQGPEVKVVSMRQVFAGLNPLAPYFADSAHLTPAGHQRLAAALGEMIRNVGAVQKKWTGAGNAAIP